ncbi:hypothetical protein Tco_0526601 [Tanacetum coccineum]
MDENTICLLLKDHQDTMEKLAQQQAMALRAELQATRGLLQNRQGAGVIKVASMSVTSVLYLKDEVPIATGGATDTFGIRETLMLTLLKHVLEIILVISRTSEGISRRLDRTNLSKQACVYIRLVKTSANDSVVAIKNHFILQVRTTWSKWISSLCVFVMYWIVKREVEAAVLFLLFLCMLRSKTRTLSQMRLRIYQTPCSSLSISRDSNSTYELLVSRPTTLGDAFFLARITEARFEAIAEKEHNIKEKADTTLTLPSEEASPVVKGPLDASEYTLLSLRSEYPNFKIQEKAVEYVRALNDAPLKVRDKFAEFFKDKGSVENVLSATKLPKCENSHSAYYPYHLEDKMNFEGVGNVTPWPAKVGRRKRVKCYVQGSGRRKRKKGYWSRLRKVVRDGLG